MVGGRAAGLWFLARSLGGVGGLPLVVAVIRTYSPTAVLNSPRTQEIGVRMALGAGRWQVVRTMTGRAIGITVAGTAIGSALAIGAGRLMESVLFGMVTTNFVQLGA